ncbi:MAG TPA: NAD-dependent epimerase/dehydratase family protein, partial [Rhizobium sp.]|nr:NAD-dependent epimerase/dehydratase family protein [Rhizobium sp.]
MRILILGGTGFIGSAVMRRLAADGHAVTGLARGVARARARWPEVQWIAADLAELQTAEAWRPQLDGFDVVVNCAGALQDGLTDDLAASQQNAMLALYEATKASSIHRIVQISARVDGNGAELPFLATKRRADTALADSGLPFVILRPALVIGRNAFGGTALLRALAAFPFVQPLIHAESPVETVDVEDVATAVALAVDGTIQAGSDIELAAPERLTLAATLALHRRWLGLAPGPTVVVPAIFGRTVTALADLAGRFGWQSPLRSTAMT